MAKTKLPKTLLGVKVPKALRKARMVKQLLKNPAGRDLLVGALTAGAAAAAQSLARGLPDTRQLANGGEALAESGAEAAGATKDTVQDAALALSGAIAKLATGFRSDESTAHAKRGAGRKVSEGRSGKKKTEMAAAASQ